MKEWGWTSQSGKCEWKVKLDWCDFEKNSLLMKKWPEINCSIFDSLKNEIQECSEEQIIHLESFIKSAKSRVKKKIKKEYSF